MGHAVKKEQALEPIDDFLRTLTPGQTLSHQTLSEALADESLTCFDLIELTQWLRDNDISLRWESTDAHIVHELGWEQHAPSDASPSNTGNMVEQYFREIANHRILSAEEEVALFRELERGKRWFRQFIYLNRATHESFLNAVDDLKEGRKSVKDILDISRSTAVSDEETEELKKSIISTAEKIDSLWSQAEELASRTNTSSTNVSDQPRAHTIRIKIIEQFEGLDLDKQLIQDWGQPLDNASNNSSPVTLVEPRVLSTAYSIADSHWQIFRDKIAASNLKLVLSIAKKYKGKEMAFSDLIQEGNLGLLKAIKKFDHEKGYKFSTYATWWIRQSMQRAIQDKGTNIRIPVHRREKMDEVFRAQEELRKTLHRDPTPEELADKLNWNKDYVEKILRTKDETVSLESKLKQGESETELKDVLADDGSSPLTDVDRDVLGEAIDDALNDLSWREEQVVRMRYGLDKQSKQTLEEIGQCFNITRERARQVEINALEKLKHPTRSETLAQYVKQSGT